MIVDHTFNLYELTRQNACLIGQETVQHEQLTVDYFSLHIRDRENTMRDHRAEFFRPPDYEEFYVMATGWMSSVVLLVIDGIYWSPRLPISWFTTYATDMDTGFARWRIEYSDSPFRTYLLTARRSQ